MDLGLEWGGNWKTFLDEPHFQLRPKWAGDMRERDMLAELRTRKDSGKGAHAPENRHLAWSQNEQARHRTSPSGWRTGKPERRVRFTTANPSCGGLEA